MAMTKNSEIKYHIGNLKELGYDIDAEKNFNGYRYTNRKGDVNFSDRFTLMGESHAMMQGILLGIDLQKKFVKDKTIL